MSGPIAAQGVHGQRGAPVAEKFDDEHRDGREGEAKPSNSIVAMGERDG